MWKSITGRITLIAVLTAVSIVVLVPSLTDRVPAGWKDRVPKINLGLDLQGGVFLRLAVEIDGLAGHAGTVPMNLRQDALAATAECVLAIEQHCASVTLRIRRLGK